MNKSAAYIYGVKTALSACGLLSKHADDMESPDMMTAADSASSADNPAELLASIFQQADVEPVKPTPDNKTKSDTLQEGKSVNWGSATANSNGGEQLGVMAPGISLPAVTAV